MPLVDPLLMEILRCPICHGDLTEDLATSELLCSGGHRYPVSNGVPDMVPPGAGEAL